MASNYEQIGHEIRNDFDRYVASTTKKFSEDTYADRTHFIFELLQNAEDAIARRGPDWIGSRAVSFDLTREQLCVGHFGDPFNGADVRGICDIDKSTKREDPTKIGRFGIGFKSVYAFTDRPEIHSGTEDFAIEKFVRPVKAPPIDDRNPDETVFLFPFKSDHHGSWFEEIAQGLTGVGSKALLFLRQIKEVRWSVEDGRSGLYLRESQCIDDSVRRVTVIGQVAGETDVDEQWLIFSQQVTSNGSPAGHVEIAFSQSEDHVIEPVARSPLIAFFPAALETHLGFLVQGPYRTTLSRENVQDPDDRNRRLVDETASLLVTSLRWLRDNNRLDTSVLRCLPLKSTQFGNESLFTPLFEATKAALRSEPLLPRYDKCYVPASRALLGRTEALRGLFSPGQLTALYGKECWLSGEFTPILEPELWKYLREVLKVYEVTPESIIPRLDKDFLESQPDDWTLRLYEFLSGQPALRQRLNSVPLIRLEDGAHVTPETDGQSKVFLPTDQPTSFPTVRASVCASEPAREFLKESLGLREVDPVDDVIHNVIPKYRSGPVNVGDAEYEGDIHLILNAYGTDWTPRQGELTKTLCDIEFVKTVDAGSGSKQLSRPSEVYLATDEYRKLFTGVQGVLFVDSTYECLRGEKVGDLLNSCGATRSTDSALADMVVKHVLAKYRSSPFQISDADYEADIERILAAYKRTDSHWGRDRLINELTDTEFVMAIDSGDGSRRRSVPGELYLARRRLKELFAGVDGVLFVDDNYECLRGEDILKLLEACDTVGHLRPVPVDSLSSEEMQKLREKAGYPYTTSRRKDNVDNWALHGLQDLLLRLPNLDIEQRRIFARLLWEELAHLEEVGKNDIFTGRYTFTHRGVHVAPFAAAFVKKLNDTKWVPNADGELELPQFVLFDSLGWVENQFLQLKIRFKPPAFRLLEQEAGFEEGMLDELKKRGINTKSNLLEMIGDFPDSGDQVADEPVGDAGQPNNQRDKIPNGFDEALLETMTPNPPKGPSNPVVLPPGGPHTPESAVRDTDRSSREGRSGRLVSRTSTRFELTDDAKDLAERVKSMSQSDYGNRCQICGSTFLTRNGEFQGFADHIVDPSKHSLTNHFGNLLSLCGWHYALISYGQWVPLDPRTRHQSQLCDGGLNTKQLRDWLVAASEEIDNDGNPYVAIPVRFWNVYLEWSPGPETIDQEIRFSKPHWTYLCELLKT